MSRTIDVKYPSAENHEAFFQSYIARINARKVLKKDPQYKILLQQHREAKAQLDKLGKHRAYLWHQIQEIRSLLFHKLLIRRFSLHKLNF